ncbi:MULTISPECIES: helix-turn-helix domain-containing protein [Bacteria]|uniref:helix-turn-helix domain-containing protein n=1 Tax=Bacteria TaxID=2 RepID=UPI003C7CF650
MDIRKRAETFSRYVGLELKGRITTQQFTAKAVAEAIGRQPAAFNRWLNGKVEIPMSVLCEACEFIDVEPSKIVEDAYSRLAVEYGERDGRIYVGADHDALVPGGMSVVGTPDAGSDVTDDPASTTGAITPFRKSVPTVVDTIDHVETPDLDRLDYAAKRGVRKADQEPWAE